MDNCSTGDHVDRAGTVSCSAYVSKLRSFDEATSENPGPELHNVDKVSLLKESGNGRTLKRKAVQISGNMIEDILPDTTTTVQEYQPMRKHSPRQHHTVGSRELASLYSTYLSVGEIGHSSGSLDSYTACQKRTPHPRKAKKLSESQFSRTRCKRNLLTKGGKIDSPLPHVIFTPLLSSSPKSKAVKNSPNLGDSDLDTTKSEFDDVIDKVTSSSYITNDLKQIQMASGISQKPLRENPKKRDCFQVVWDTKHLKSTSLNGSETVTLVKKDSSARVLTKAALKHYPNYLKIPPNDSASLTSTPGKKEHSPAKLDTRMGHLVWAKLGVQPWWPAIITSGPMCGFPSPGSNSSWVMWFGDLKVSKLTHNRIVPFIANYRDHAPAPPIGKHMLKSLIEALEECVVRTKEQFLLNLLESRDPSLNEELLSWASNGFLVQGIKANCIPTSHFETPTWMSERMNELRRINERSDTSDEDDDDDSTEEKPYRIDMLKQGSRMDWVRSGTMKIEDVCIACESGSVVVQHPCFRGGLCQECQNDMMECMFIYGNDGLKLYCIICANAGELLVCEDLGCKLVYCTGCIVLLIGKQEVSKIKANDNWHCYMCRDLASGPYVYGLLEIKSNWRQNVKDIFESNDLNKKSLPDPVRPIRVLSLFDGIGTGKIALDGLGMDIDVYYTCEIDPDALMVVDYRHPDKVHPLGDICHLNHTMIQKICPIDLVIGGSPCNDFSIVNPSRQGMNSESGRLFHEFHRVLTEVQMFSPYHVFWLYENVSSMTTDVRNTISRFLRCQPVVWDALMFTPQQRRRNFWGNLPGMYCPQQLVNLPEIEKRLDDSLISEKRKAKVLKVRAITTNKNSLMQGKNDGVFTVQDGESPDTLWIPELEMVFGFPAHYTDVRNLPPTRRQKLLGKAWSVPVVQHLLGSLKQFYKTTDS